LKRLTNGILSEVSPEVKVDNGCRRSVVSLRRALWILFVYLAQVTTEWRNATAHWKRNHATTEDRVQVAWDAEPNRDPSEWYTFEFVMALPDPVAKAPWFCKRMVHLWVCDGVSRTRSLRLLRSVLFGCITWVDPDAAIYSQIFTQSQVATGWKLWRKNLLKKSWAVF